MPLIIAARAGLGTINHALLTIEAARAVGLDVRGVVLTPWPDAPSVMERSNRATIARSGAIEVAGLPRRPPRPRSLPAPARRSRSSTGWASGGWVVLEFGGRVWLSRVCAGQGVLELA